MSVSDRIASSHLMLRFCGVESSESLGRALKVLARARAAPSRRFSFESGSQRPGIKERRKRRKTSEESLSRPLAETLARAPCEVDLETLCSKADGVCALLSGDQGPGPLTKFDHTQTQCFTVH